METDLTGFAKIIAHFIRFGCIKGMFFVFVNKQETFYPLPALLSYTVNPFIA
jgi:hypothetical protein